MAADLVRPIFVGKTRCNSIWKAARKLKQKRRGDAAGGPVERKVIAGRMRFLHPTKGYRAGPHYPASMRKVRAMRRGEALIEALMMDLAA